MAADFNNLINNNDNDENKSTMLYTGRTSPGNGTGSPSRVLATPSSFSKLNKFPLPMTPPLVHPSDNYPQFRAIGRSCDISRKSKIFKNSINLGEIS